MRATMFLMLLFVAVAMTSCFNNDRKIITVSSMNNVVDMVDDIKEFDTGSVLVGKQGRLAIAGNQIVIGDGGSIDKMIHLYDKKSLKYLGSTGNLGQGPGEISILGTINYDNSGKLLVTDFGHYFIYGFDIDSLLRYPDYLPYVKKKINSEAFPGDYVYVSDTLCFGTFIQPTSESTFNQVVGKWNFNTGAFSPITDDETRIKKKRMTIAYSGSKDLLVVCYSRADLISIYDGNFNLISHVYGPDWEKGSDSRYNYTDVVIINDRIIASYEGSLYRENKNATKCHVFDMRGNYIKTLYIGHPILQMAGDENSERLYFTFDDEIQFGYLDLKGILN